MTENEERFLREIATRVPLARVEEVHLFAPLRQSGAESGVAVVAVGGAPAEPEGAGAGATEADEGVEPAEAAPAAVSENMRARYAVYTARYRHTYKGVERGKWEFEMAADADAPLLSIDRVVSGVLQRSGEQGEPVRLSSADIRAAIGDVNCSPTK